MKVLQSLLQPSNPTFKSLNVPPRNLPVLAHTILKLLDRAQQLIHPRALVHLFVLDRAQRPLELRRGRMQTGQRPEPSEDVRDRGQVRC